MAAFFLQPIAFGSWLPRLPEVQQAIGLGPAGLALALLGLPCGTLLTLPFAGPLVSRIGARRAMLIGFPLCLIAVCLPPLATGQIWLFLALLLAGSTISFLELGLNVEAAQTEAATGKLIMSTAHGFWSLGIMAGSLVGAALAGLNLAPMLSLPLVALACLVPALLAVRALPGHEAAMVPDKDVAGKQRLGLPSVALLGICLFVFGITLTEGAMADWSAIYMRDVLAVDAATAGLGYSVFALLVAAGRFSGDRLKARFGASALARGCGLLGLVGAALLLVAPNVAVALIGFATIGVGVSVGFPLAVSAVAGLPGSSARGVAVLSFVALLGFLVGPVVIGVVAEHVGLRVGLAALLPVLLLSLLLSGRLRRPPAAAGLVEKSSAGAD